jgi:tripartite-type tricarboxylate transporter receptor subunit TctC
MKRRQFLGRALAGALLGPAVAPLARAAGYPDKPIRIVIPFEPGGPTDILVRAITPILNHELKQNIIVENKGGAGGSIGSAYVARANDEGYTLLAGGSPTVITPFFMPNQPFDTQRDLVAVAPLCTSPYYLVVNSSLPANSVRDLIAMAKKSPGTLTYASSGVGNRPHVAGAQFAILTGTDMTHVPYKGTAPATNDLLAGRVTFMFTGMATVRGHIQAGKLKVLAVATPKRDPEFPNVPTLAEAGVPDYYPNVWYGLLGPANMPQQARQKVNRAVQLALRDPAVEKQYAVFGATPYIAGVKDFQAFYDGEIKQWHDFFQAHPELLKEQS